MDKKLKEKIMIMLIGVLIILLSYTFLILIPEGNKAKPQNVNEKFLQEKKLPEKVNITSNLKEKAVNISKPSLNSTENTNTESEVNRIIVENKTISSKVNKTNSNESLVNDLDPDDKFILRVLDSLSSS